MLEAVQRANIYCETLGPEQFGIIQKPLTLAEKIYNQAWLRKIAILVVLAGAWEIYGRWLDNPLLVPPFSDAMQALLTDVANGTCFEDFKSNWETASRKWVGGIEAFRETSKAIRDIWEGRHANRQGEIVKRGLGLIGQRDEHSAQWPIEVSWGESCVFIRTRSLNDVVWFALLQHSQQLAICANRDGGCETPYFIQRKSDHKFCSPECGLPTLRESKRNWWVEHGELWRSARAEQLKKAVRQKRGKRKSKEV